MAMAVQGQTGAACRGKGTDRRGERVQRAVRHGAGAKEAGLGTSLRLRLEPVGRGHECGSKEATFPTFPARSLTS